MDVTLINDSNDDITSCSDITIGGASSTMGTFINFDNTQLYIDSGNGICTDTYNNNKVSLNYDINELISVFSSITDINYTSVKDGLLKILYAYDRLADITKGLAIEIFKGFLDFYIKNICETFNHDNLCYLEYTLMNVNEIVYSIDDIVPALNNDDITNKYDNIGKIGIELTFHNKTFLSDDDIMSCIYKNKAKNIYKIYLDCGMIEYVTKPLYSSEIDEVVEGVYEQASKYHLNVFDECSSGGGIHFNIDLQLDKKNIYINLCRLLHNLPQLNWIFNSPLDNKTANSLYFLKNKETIFSSTNTTNKAFNSKSYAIRFVDNNYFELRFFEMPHNYDEYLIFKNFVIALVKFCDIGEVFPLIKREISSIGNAMYFSESLDVFTDEFNMLLAELNLNKCDYQFLIDRNLNKRFNNKLKLI